MKRILLLFFSLLLLVGSKKAEKKKPEKVPEKHSLSILVFLQHDYVHLRNVVRALDQVHFTSDKEILLIETVQDYFKGESIEKDPLFSHCVHVPFNQSANGLADLYDQSWRKANGDLILFMTDNVELGKNFFSNALLEKISEKQVGMLTTKLLNGEGSTIYSAGIDFRLATLPTEKNKRVSSKHDTNVPLPVSLYQGYDEADERTSKAGALEALSRTLMLTTVKHLRTVNGFNRTFTNAYFDLDLSLRLKASSLRLLYFPSSQALVYNSEVERQGWLHRPDAERFLQIHGKALEDHIRSKYEVPNLMLKWNMECGSGSVLGFTTEAIGFVLGLEERIPLRVEVSDVDGCGEELKKAGFPLYVQDTVVRLARKAKDANTSTVLVIHRDPGRYSSFTSNAWSDDREDYIIGRSMYETDKIPTDWVKKCNEIPDEVLLNLMSFAGVNASNLFVLPEPTDIHTYNPKTVKSLKIDRSTSFHFLAIGKWEERKDWATLIGAYLEEFTIADNTTLILRTHIEEKRKVPCTVLLTFKKSEYEGIVAAVLNSTGREPEDLPHVHILQDSLPFVKLPSLHRSSDAFVMASHGEGWGLPLSEAMSMGLPVIATNWSGSTEFLTNTTSLLLRVKEMTAAHEKGHQWAQADALHLRELMRYVYENKEASVDIGKLARQRIVSEFSVEVVAEKVLSRLKEIEPLIPAAKAKRAKKTPTPAPRNNYNNYNRAPRSPPPPPPPPPKKSPSGRAVVRAKIN